MGTEYEWKMAVSDAGRLDLVLKDPEVCALAAEPVRTIEMRSVYYDTPDRLLSARRITLRQRSENGSPVVCLKAPLPDAPDPRMRGEWEVPGLDPAAALPALAALGAPGDLPDTGALFPVCGAEFRRRAVLLRFSDGSAAELALDLGRLTGARTSLPLCELELEMKAGAPEAARAFLDRLALRFGLQPEPRSKYARAKQLS